MLKDCSSKAAKCNLMHVYDVDVRNDDIQRIRPLIDGDIYIKLSSHGKSMNYCKIESTVQKCRIVLVADDDIKPIHVLYLDEDARGRYDILLDTSSVTELIPLSRWYTNFDINNISDDFYKRWLNIASNFGKHISYTNSSNFLVKILNRMAASVIEWAHGYLDLNEYKFVDVGNQFVSEFIALLRGGCSIKDVKAYLFMLALSDNLPDFVKSFNGDSNLLETLAYFITIDDALVYNIIYGYVRYLSDELRSVAQITEYASKFVHDRRIQNITLDDLMISFFNDLLNGVEVDCMFPDRDKLNVFDINRRMILCSR